MGQPVQVLECGSSLAENVHHAEIIDRSSAVSKADTTCNSMDSLRERIAADVVVSPGQSYSTFDSPFITPTGFEESNNKYMTVPLVYCDQTASNRPLSSIEDYVHRECLPLYGNTHTNTSVTGCQSTAFVAEARQIIAEETNAKVTGKASQDIVLFAGNGATSCVELLIDCLGIAFGVEDGIRPVVFVGPYEHHSNLIPWRESGCEVVTIPESEAAKDVDLKCLEETLRKPEYKDRLKLGTFSAASNVTGKLSDVDSIAAVLHQNDALAFFDYATAAPYVKIDMNPPANERFSDTRLIAKDAVFISAHKIIGGVGAPGVLVVKKNLVSQSNAPHRSGGGVVFYVTSKHHRFLSNRIERYEGGTPNVVGIVRAGLSFLYKRQVEQSFRESTSSTHSTGALLDFETAEYQKVAAYWREHAPNLVLLGHDDKDHLPIFSFLIRFNDKYLHYNYVCAILNDVFGIQTRGGCNCAGPYSQALLGLSHEGIPNLENEQIERALVECKGKAELLRPGYTRLSLPFKGITSEEVQYVLKAVSWSSEHAWKLMCQYRCNHKTGEWRHHHRQGKPLGREARKWLSHFRFNEAYHQPRNRSLSRRFEWALMRADALLVQAYNDKSNISQALKMSDSSTSSTVDSDEATIENLRWYATVQESASLLNQGGSPVLEKCTRGPLRPQGQAGDDQDSTNESAKQERKRFPPQSDFSRSTAAVYSFQNGQHSGEASLQELVEGLDSGDVSKECRVFSVAENEWVSLKSVLDQEELAESETISSEINQTACKRQKKAPRLVSQWGNGEVYKIPTPEPLQSTAAVNGISKKRSKHTCPPGKLMRPITKAIMQWSMIEEGDKLLLGLSGGKDSISLLHCLLEYRRKAVTKFDLEVCTIDPGTSSYDPSSLIPYVESLGLKYHYIRDKIIERAEQLGEDGKKVTSLCAYCARMKRGHLYATARKAGANKLVLGQHEQDANESFMMSLFHNGFLRTMKAKYQINAGDLWVIRPMMYCRESLMTEFAKKAGLPVVNENCPACFEEPKERARMKKLLAREEAMYPNLFDNMRRAILPLMHDDLTGILRSYTNEITQQKKKGATSMNEVEKTDATVTSNEQTSLATATDEDLLLELAKRRANKSRLSGMVKTEAPHTESADPTGQVCSLLGGNGTIPCRELME